MCIMCDQKFLSHISHLFNLPIESASVDRRSFEAVTRTIMITLFEISYGCGVSVKLDFFLKVSFELL